MKQATSDYYDIEIDGDRWVLESYNELKWAMAITKHRFRGIDLPKLETTASNVFNNETEENQKKMASSKDLKAILPQTTWRRMKGAR